MRHDEKDHRSTRPAGRFLVARLGWIVVVAAAVTGGAALLSWSRTPMYQSKAEVLVEGRSTGTSSAAAPDMGTERAVATSGAVLAIAGTALGVPPDDLGRGLTVSVPVDTHLLQIADSHRDPAEARRRAQGVAEAYVAFRSASPAGQAEPAKGGPTAAARTGATPAASPAASPGTPARTGAAAGVPSAEVITPASLPAAPASPDHLVDLGVALVIGLCLGVGAALARDRLDDHLRGPADLAAHLRAPTLGLLPAFRPPGRDLPGRLVTAHNPASPAAGAYRDLRSRVCQVAARRDAGTLLVTSPAGEARTTVAANLAVALATSGRSVVLVCADPARSRAHEYFGLGDGEGLAGVVDGRATLAAELRPTPVPGLSVLPAGPAGPDAGTVLDRPTLPGVLAELWTRADFVIVDGPPALAGADAAGLAEHVDMILVVADARRTTRHQVDAVRHELDHARAKLVGAVLDNVGRRIRLPGSRPPASAPTPRPDPGSVPTPRPGPGFVPAAAPDPEPAGTTDEPDHHRNDPAATVARYRVPDATRG